MKLEEIIGKTVKSVEREMYYTTITINFTDGTTLKLVTGSTGIHNDRWSTVEYILEEQQKNSKNERPRS